MMSTVNRILLVEDDLAALSLLERMIHRIEPSASVKTAVTAEEAYRTLYEDNLDHQVLGPKHLPFDLVVADLKLPGSDGLVLMEVAGRKFPALDFLFVSGISFEEWSKRLEKFSSWPALLRKPITEEKLKQFWNEKFSLAGQFGG